MIQNQTITNLSVGILVFNQHAKNDTKFDDRNPVLDYCKLSLQTYTYIKTWKMFT
jgi:hypothetical protein